LDPEITRPSRERAIFPPLAWQYFLISAASLVIAAMISDRIVIPLLESRSAAVAAAWKDEDLRLTRQNVKKISASHERPWETRGLSVAAGRKRAHRILAIGDSFTWGDGYANINDLWWRQLERELHRRGYDDVEVVAGAMPGMSTRDELELAKHLVPQLRPDLVIFGYVTNDAEEGAVPYLEMPPRDRFERFLDRVRPFVPNIEAMLTDRHRRKAVLRSSGERNGYPYPDRELMLVRGTNFERYRRTVADLRDYFAFVHVPVFSVTLPQFPSRTYFEPRLAPVRTAYASAGVPFLDVLPQFVKQYGDVGNDAAAAARWGINPANIHPGSRAAHFYAVKVADVLEASYAQLIGAKSHASAPQRVLVNDWLPYDLQPTVNLRNTISFDYPDERNLLRMPEGRPFVQLNFAEPARLRSIAFEGRDLVSASIGITVEDPNAHYDSHDVRHLGEQSGASLAWNIPVGVLVNTIRLEPHFRGVDRIIDRHVRVVITPFDGVDLAPMDFQESAPPLPQPRVPPRVVLAARGSNAHTTIANTQHEWQLVTAADIDGDAHPDLVWYNFESGKVTATTRRGEIDIATAPPGWSVAGVISGDRMLWRNASTGANAIARGAMRDAVNLPAMRGTWSFAGAADFDADGRVDLVWRNEESGENEVWLMDGAVVRRVQPLATIPATASHIEAVGDIDGDGSADLIWRNYGGGDVVAWLMRGTTMKESVPIATIANRDYSIRGAADFDGDGRLDLLWRNAATGENIMWRMNGTKLVSSTPLQPRRDRYATASTGAPAEVRWTLIATADFDGDGVPDSLLHDRFDDRYELRTARHATLPFASLDDFLWSIRSRWEQPHP
jgi:lysophospholipase L1-like esterase